MEYPDSHDLNFSNRLVRTRMPGGVAGARLTAAPYADQAGKKVAGIKHYIAAAPVVPEMLSPVIA